MTGIVDSSPVDGDIDEFLTRLEDEWLDDTVWVDAEFYAIIAANWDTEPPEPPGPPAGLPARWTPPRRSRQPGSIQPVTDQVTAGHRHRRQRSPPRR